MKLTFSLACFICLLSCSTNRSLQREIDSLKAELEEERNAATGPEFYHLVFLKLKAGLNQQDVDKLKGAINNLRYIEVINEFHQGSIADSGDQRFISDHDIIFSLSVSSMADYKLYREHPLHLELIKVAKDKLERAPAVYDYWTHKKSH